MPSDYFRRAFEAARPEIEAKIKAAIDEAISGESFSRRASQRRSVPYADHVESGTHMDGVDAVMGGFVAGKPEYKISPDSEYVTYYTGGQKSGKATNLEIIDAAERAAAAGASPTEIGEMVKRWRAGAPVVIDGSAKESDDAQ